MAQNTQLTTTDIDNLATPYINQLAKFESIISGARGISTSVVECRRLTAQVELQAQKLDYQINQLLVQAQHDLSRRRLYVPVIGRQLDRIQDRIDLFSDKLMNLLDDFSEEGFKKQSLLLDFIERQNDKLQHLSIRLMQ